MGGLSGSGRSEVVEKMIPVPQFFLTVVVWVERFLGGGGCFRDGSIRLVDLSRGGVYTIYKCIKTDSTKPYLLHKIEDFACRYQYYGFAVRSSWFFLPIFYSPHLPTLNLPPSPSNRDHIS